MKKILFPVQVFYPSQAGGPANTVFFLTKLLRSNGYEPIIVSTDQGLPEDVERDKWLDQAPGKTIYVRTRHHYFPLRHTIRSLLALYRVDAVHLSSFLFPTAFITGIAARLLGKKIAWSARGELDDYSLSYSRSRKLPILWILKKVIGAHPYFHSTSDEESRFIRLRFGNESTVAQITNYIEVPQLVEREPENYLLFVGRIHRKKGIENLIKAVSISSEFARHDIKLKIAGTGPTELVATISELIKDLGLEHRIEMLGHIEGDEKLQLFANAYFTFMPSFSENFGNVVVESLAQGTPVVASIYTPWGQLEKERIGHWVDNTPAVLAEVIDTILTMEASEYQEMRARSRPFVLANFEIRENADKWLAFYRRLENGHRVIDDGVG